MKNLLLIVVLAIPFSSLSQDRKLEFGIGIGNNGQLEKTLGDFYIWNHETYYLDDSYNDKTFYLKYNVFVKYVINDKVSVRLKYGYAQRTDYYISNLTPVYYYTYDSRQHVSNISTSICFSKQLDNFEISTGIEVPLMSVSPFIFEIIATERLDSIHISQVTSQEIKMKGGFIWGINNFLSVKYYFLKRFSIGTEISYGLLSARLGGNWKSTIEYYPQVTSNSNYEIDKKYKKTFFSAPEFSFGFSFKL